MTFNKNLEGMITDEKAMVSLRILPVSEVGGVKSTNC
jgi:hypothetical protein